MAIMRKYSNIVQAHEAVAFLLRCGVPATAISDRMSAPGTDGSRHFVVVDEADVDRAAELLAELEALPQLSPADWEAQITPDLTRLAPNYAPPCPHCNHVLPMREQACVCPGCAAQVDVVALLIAQHGPDVLSACYPDASDLGDDMTDSTVTCPECRYSLAGLAATGLCPECGLPFDKHDLLRQRAGM